MYTRTGIGKRTLERNLFESMELVDECWKLQNGDSDAFSNILRLPNMEPEENERLELLTPEINEQT